MIGGNVTEKERIERVKIKGKRRREGKNLRERGKKENRG